MSVTVSVRTSGGAEYARAEGEREACLCYTGEYREGDRIVFSCKSPFARIRVDECIPPCVVYLPTGEMEYRIPFGEARLAHPPAAFCGGIHALSICEAEAYETDGRRNLALNPADQRGDVTAYPHATANIETRGEAVFAARCAIDGDIANHAHGSWPCQSWGPDIETDPALTVDFGREVFVDGISLTLRADFPHDAWWEAGEIAFSDGGVHSISIRKTDQTQYFPVGLRRTRSITLRNLKKAADPSPFPALMEIGTYGMEVDAGETEIVRRAIRWAIGKLGSEEYRTLCLAFIEDAVERGNNIEIFGGDCARESGEKYGAAANSGQPPVGAFVFYDCAGEWDGKPVDWGHCGLSLGGGLVIHAWGSIRIDDYRAIERLTPAAGWTQMKYVGYAPISRVLAGFRPKAYEETK